MDGPNHIRELLNTKIINSLAHNDRCFTFSTILVDLALELLVKKQKLHKFSSIYFLYFVSFINHALSF